MDRRDRHNPIEQIVGISPHRVVVAIATGLLDANPSIQWNFKLGDEISEMRRVARLL